jgi:hypothetical protein
LNLCLYLRLKVGVQLQCNRGVSANTAQTNIASNQALPDFNDATAAFQAKSTKQLLQSLAVFTVCTSQPFIRNADRVFDISKRVFSGPLVISAVKATFFKHFCAGKP